MKKKRSWLSRIFFAGLSLAFIIFIICVAAYLYLESHLPDVDTLNNVQLQVPLRIYSADDLLMAEYGEKRRMPVTIDDIPKHLIEALLATEDQRFYEHPGVDIWGLGRAAIQIIRTGEKVQGGSTITMQVARNFFLNRKKTYIRKLNEILLAIKIDHELSKDKILELYLNKIYFGHRAYGVAAAANVYYGKSLKDLSLAQQAMIAGLPKAPSQINPLTNRKAAMKRRNHVLARMLEEGYIDRASYENAMAEPLMATYHERKIALKAPYVAEMIRQALMEKYGRAIYTNGYQVHTTVQSKLQNTAKNVLIQGILNYDRRHGYRGPISNVGAPDKSELSQWMRLLKKIPSIPPLEPAIVVDTSQQTAHAMKTDGQIITLPWQGIRWARAKIDTASEVLKPGDVIYVLQEKDQYYLAQNPNVEAALIALNPNNGAVLSMVGGFNFNKSKFNRATQMERQPGSAFKPFIYAAAMDKGMTMASIVNDAPIVLNDPSLQKLWRPQNDTRVFYGPTRMRLGLIHSRNLVSIRLLEYIGLDFAIDFLSRFGFDRGMLPKSLSLALGSLDITPLQLGKAYAVFANGGYAVEPYIIDRIDNARGKTLFKEKPLSVCGDCDSDTQKPAQRVISAEVAYLMTSALQDVIQHGTGRGAKKLGRHDLAGKTGTTNDQVDAWFAGFNRDIVVVNWVGFDKPETLREYASKSALPIWVNFMRAALAGKAEHTLARPSGLVTVRIDPKTGRLAYPGQENSIFETFRTEKLPTERSEKPTSVEQDKAPSNYDEPLF